MADLSQPTNPLASADDHLARLLAPQEESWFRSLHRDIKELIHPPKLPPLEVTWEPANPIVPSQALLLTSWSNVIKTPKVFLPDKVKPVITPASPGLSMPQPVAPDPETVAFVYDLERDMLRDLRRSRRRERFLMVVFAAELIVLVGGFFWHR